MPCILCLPGLKTPYFLHFSRYLADRALLLRVRPLSTFALLLSDNMKVTGPLIGPLYPGPFSASTPPLFLLRLLYFPPRYASKTRVMASLYTYLPVALPTTSFLAAFTIKSLPYPRPFVILDVRRAIFGTLYTNV